MLLQVTAVVVRFRKLLRTKWKRKRQSQDEAAAATVPSTPESTVVQQLLTAELLWIRSEQSKFLLIELAYLRKARGVRPTLVSQCDLFLDKDGIVRCGGHLRFSH